MKPFNYLVADTLTAAQTRYAQGGCALKANGVDLVDRMKEGLVEPEAVLSIGSIKDLAYIREDGGAIRIGCLATLADLGRSELLAKRAPALQQVAADTATPQVRERATVGGNLCQRPRCWYYRNIEFECLKKGGPQCFAPEGENQYHAIIGGGPCHIVHPSSLAVPLAAMDAEFKVAGRGGERVVKAADFFVLPSKRLDAENILAEGEIVTEIAIPKPPDKSAVIELREKQSFDWPTVMTAVARVGGQWRVCLGAVAPIPWLSKPAMDALGAKEITEALARQAGEAAASEAKPLEENGYKVQQVRVAVRRALMAAAGLEKQS
jgi:xanthine dehydrogenase YagS FAD-binding subunit